MKHLPITRSGRWLAAISVTLAVFSMVYAVLWIWEARQPAPWTPLYGPLAGQRVVDQTAGYVDVEGQKCNGEGTAVWIRGTVSAQQMSPIGASIDIGTGEGVRLPGCTALKFRNAYDDRMVDVTEKVGGSVVWRFYGIDRPIGLCRASESEVPDGVQATRLLAFLPSDVGPPTERAYYCWRKANGVEWSWTTENFTLPYEGD